MACPPPDAAPVSFAATEHVRDHCLCLHAQRAARGLARRFDAVLRPHGLTSGQFSLLMSLNRPQPAPMAAVAALLAMDRTTLTAALKPLERRGLVASVANPADRRSRGLVLTGAGRARLAEALPAWTRTHAEVDALLETRAHGPGDDLRGALRALA